jgi:hypothetical protein
VHTVALSETGMSATGPSQKLNDVRVGSAVRGKAEDIYLVNDANRLPELHEHCPRS